MVHLEGNTQVVQLLLAVCIGGASQQVGVIGCQTRVNQSALNTPLVVETVTQCESEADGLAMRYALLFLLYDGCGWVECRISIIFRSVDVWAVGDVFSI